MRARAVIKVFRILLNLVEATETLPFKPSTTMIVWIKYILLKDDQFEVVPDPRVLSGIGIRKDNTERTEI